jgi:hypothetical protein
VHSKHIGSNLISKEKIVVFFKPATLCGSQQRYSWFLRSFCSGISEDLVVCRCDALWRSLDHDILNVSLVLDLPTLEDEGKICLWNIGIQLRCDAASFPRRTKSSKRVFYGLVLIQTKQYLYYLRLKFHLVETGHAVVKTESVTNVSPFETYYWNMSCRQLR